MTLRSRLTATFVAVVLVPLLVGVFLLASTLPGAFAERQERSVSRTAALAGLGVTGWCDRARAAAEAAGRAVLAVPDPAQAEPALRSLVDRGLAAGVSVTSADGRTVTAGAVPAPSAPPVDCVAGQVSEGVLTARVRLDQTGSPSPGEAVATVLAGASELEVLRRAADVDALLLVAGDEIVAGSGPAPAALLRAAVAAPGTPVRDDGVIAVSVPLRAGSPLAVFVTEPAARGVDLLGTAVAVVLGAVLLAAGLALLLARATTRPLEDLGAAAARVAGGDLDTPIVVRSRDEVGKLAAAFNTMTEELRTQMGALEASRRELRAGLARLGETLTSTHDLDRILAVVLETALASTAAPAGAVLLVDRRGDVLELAVGRGLAERGVGVGLSLPLGQGLLGRVASDAQAVTGRLDELAPSPAEPPAATVVAVPLRGATSVLGVLVLYDPRSDGTSGEADLQTLETLAGQAAVAMENVLVHRDAQRMALTDALTGLGNYRSFTAAIDKEIERASRYGRPVGLLLLDLDHFKAVNDTHGHQRGDAVLIELAGRVVGQVRDVDTVARYGGEELVVVLPETDETGAVQAAERIRDAVRERPFGSAGQAPVHVTASIGVAVYPRHAASASALLRRADEALYEAKRAGRDAFRLAVLVGGSGVAD